MKRATTPISGVNTVSYYGGVEELEYLLEFIERKLQEAGLPVEFINVEQHQAGGRGEAKLRFTVLIDGKEH